MNTIKFTFYLLTAVSFFSPLSLAGTPQHTEEQSIYILRQANDIPLEQFIQIWPPLKTCIDSSSISPVIDSVCLEGMMTSSTKSGALNLKAQILRNNDEFESAQKMINAAIKIDEEQHLHYFQLAINSYQQLRKATTNRSKWMLSMATAKAYKKAFDRSPTKFHYRYYFIYHLLQLPESMGGDKNKALQLANQAIEQNLIAFYPVRADVYHSLGKNRLALTDYLMALEHKQYKRSSFKKPLLLAKNDKKLTAKLRAFIEQAEHKITAAK